MLFPLCTKLLSVLELAAAYRKYYHDPKKVFRPLYRFKFIRIFSGISPTIGRNRLKLWITGQIPTGLKARTDLIPSWQDMPFGQAASTKAKHQRSNNFQKSCLM